MHIQMLHIGCLLQLTVHGACEKLGQGQVVRVHGETTKGQVQCEGKGCIIHHKDLRLHEVGHRGMAGTWISTRLLTGLYTAPGHGPEIGTAHV